MDMYNRIFVFSQQQMNQRKAIEGSNVQFGTVYVNGIPKKYTDMVISMDQVPFADAKKLIEGDFRSIRYTEPS